MKAGGGGPAGTGSGPARADGRGRRVRGRLLLLPASSARLGTLSAAALFAVACAAASSSPGESAGPPPPIAGESPIAFFLRGGLFMWPLLICALVTIVVIVERFLTYRRQKVDTRRLMARIIADLRGGGIERAKETCIHTRGPVAAILHAGLSKAHLGPVSVEKAIESAGAIEAAFLERHLAALGSITHIALMLGFLGTVSGMVRAFDAVSAAGLVAPRVVATGVSEALITTLTGFLISIPAQIAHRYFLSRVDGFVLEMEESAVELMEFLSEEALTGRGAGPNAR